MTTKIEWCDETWNPVVGCSKISEGCENCYAQTMLSRFKGSKGWPKDDKVTLFPDRLEQPFKWKKPKSIFVCSMSDLFHEDVPFDFVCKVFKNIKLNPKHTFLILTKRPDRMLRFLSEQYFDIQSPNNLHIGVSIENQQTADERIPLLLQCPAAKRFVSAEPLLEKVDLKRIEWPNKDGHRVDVLRFGYWDKNIGFVNHGDMYDDYGNPIDWVITGAETGRGARPMNLEWARSLRDQCKAANVPFFFKKASGGQPTPSDLKIREFPK